MDKLPQGFVRQNMIDHPDEERCELTVADVEDLKKFFPKTAEFLEPNALMTSDCASEEWVCFLEYPFLIGLTFPFPPFILRFFEKTGLAFAQLMPVGWRNLVTLGRLSAEMNIRIDLEELGFCYDLRSHGNKRFGFRVKSKSNSLVTDSIDRDRKWKNRFFYVKKSTLEHMENINSFWLDEALKLDELFPKRADTLNVVASVVALSPRKRKFLRPATPSGEEEVEEAEEEEKSSIKALQVATVMSTDTTSQPSVGGVSSLIARFKRQKKEVTKPNIPRDEGTKPKLMLGDMVSFKKRKSEIVGVDTGESIEEVLAQKAYDAVSMLSSEVKLWKGKAEMSKVEGEKKVKDIQKEMESKVSSMQVEIDKKDLEIKEWMKKTADLNQAHQVAIKVLEERLTREAGKVVFEARIQMIEEYQAGKHLEWNLKDEKATLKGIIDEEAGEVNSKLQDGTNVEQVGDNQENGNNEAF